MKNYITPTMFTCLVAFSMAAQPAGVPPVPKPAPGAPKADVSVETIVQDVTSTVNDTVRGEMKKAQAAVIQANGNRRAVALTFGSGAKSSSRSLAIQTSDVDREKVDAIEEDLSVMARILQKAARSMRDDDRFSSMGVDLDSSLFGSASGARNIYLEGHGALFLLRVEYPLVGPRENVEQPAQEPTPSVWDQAKNDVLGEHEEHEALFKVNRGRSEPYDEAKVDALKTALLESVKNASNIRHLAPQEFITVVVQGGDTMTSTVRIRKEKDKDKDKDKEKETRSRSVQKGESVMTLRVSKADVDAYAAGKLDADAFRKKATVQTYLRRGEPSRIPLR